MRSGHLMSPDTGGFLQPVLLTPWAMPAHCTEAKRGKEATWVVLQLPQRPAPRSEAGTASTQAGAPHHPLLSNIVQLSHHLHQQHLQKSCPDQTPPFSMGGAVSGLKLIHFGVRIQNYKCQTMCRALEWMNSVRGSPGKFLNMSQLEVLVFHVHLQGSIPALFLPDFSPNLSHQPLCTEV